MPDLIVPIEDDDQRQHFAVLFEAYNLFCSRNAIRGDMWRQFAPSDKIRELRERVSRIENARNISAYKDTQGGAEIRQAIRDDALDVVNYATFLIKQIDEGAAL